MSRSQSGRRSRGAFAIVLALGAALVLSGCGFGGLYKASLPGSVGGPFSGAKTYTVTVYFDNVLDLVPQSAVKVNDVTVGSVTDVSLVRDPDTTSDDYLAKVTCKVKTSVHLPANTQAILQETSLLGEKFVELTAPAKPTGTLVNGASIDKGATSAYPTAEQVFGVLSTILNGGGIEKLQTISSELSAALAGREDQVRDVLSQLNTFVGGLNVQRTEITRAITGLDKLAGDLNAQSSTIATALDDLGPGLKVIADNRAQLVSLLQGLSNLGVVSNRIVTASVSDTRADLAELAPILTQLNAAGAALPGALDLLVDYPFSSLSTNAIHGDYTSLHATIDGGSTLSAGLAKNLAVICSTAANAGGSSTAGLNSLCSALGGVLALIPGLGDTSSRVLTPQGGGLGGILKGTTS
jgi:phospholipid/cholesterol/gamma-HCH transport system substrate-binding protein